MGLGGAAHLKRQHRFSDLRKEMDTRRICIDFVPVTLMSYFPETQLNHHQIIKSQM
jgi:hypothetical protein